jgi:hypothetical protein
MAGDLLKPRLLLAPQSEIEHNSDYYHQGN